MNESTETNPVNAEDLDTAVLVQDELQILRDRANLLGVRFHPSISLDKLREKVVAATSGEATPPDEAKAPEPVEETVGQKRNRLKREALALVRIRITCMNPAKSEWEGEIFTAGNSLIGSVKKFVPFNADEGWHVPRIIYNQMVDRQCQIFVTRKDGRGNSVREGKLIKEFAIEVLPQLTASELAELARRQAMANSVG